LLEQWVPFEDQELVVLFVGGARRLGVKVLAAQAQRASQRGALELVVLVVGGLEAGALEHPAVAPGNDVTREGRDAGAAIDKEGVSADVQGELRGCVYKIPRRKIPRRKIPRRKIPRRKIPRRKIPRRKIPGRETLAEHGRAAQQSCAHDAREERPDAGPEHAAGRARRFGAG